MDVFDAVAHVPQMERVLALERVVVAVVPTLVPIYVDEGLPLTRNGPHHLVVEVEDVRLPGANRRHPLAVGGRDVPSEPAELPVEVDVELAPRVRTGIE